MCFMLAPTHRMELELRESSMELDATTSTIDAMKETAMRLESKVVALEISLDGQVSILSDFPRNVSVQHVLALNIEEARSVPGGLLGDSACRCRATPRQHRHAPSRVATAGTGPGTSGSFASLIVSS